MAIPGPDFEQMPERKLLSLSRDFTMETRSEIPKLWSDFWAAAWELNGEVEPAQYGVSYAVQPDGKFSYAVGVNVTPSPADLPDNACVMTLSAGRYAVFRKQGSVQELPELFDGIFSTWLPNSGETLREGAVFERYPSEQTDAPDTISYEIWVPVADKTT